MILSPLSFDSLSPSTFFLLYLIESKKKNFTNHQILQIYSKSRSQIHQTLSLKKKKKFHQTQNAEVKKKKMLKMKKKM